MRPFLILLSFGCLLAALLPASACADEKLKGIACRSVHFAYPGPDADLFANQITVQKSAPGTYFCVIGWNKGYFGIQQLANDRRVAIFSVWDSGDNDPAALPAEQRTQVLYVDPDVTVRRFGGEGSGGQSFLPFDWKEGQTYHFAVVSRPLGHRTAYSGWLKDPETDQWRHMVTFSTITGGQPMNGFYSFVEDFKRDRQSTHHTRSATFRNMLRHPIANPENWQPQSRARFTADSNPVMNIDAQSTTDGIQLSTGGEIQNQQIALGSAFDFTAPTIDHAPWATELLKASHKTAITPTERQQVSQGIMQNRQVPFLETLSPLPLIQQTTRRKPQQVHQRLLIETALASRAAGLPRKDYQPLLDHLDPSSFTAAEKTFLNADRIDVNDQIDYLWRAERAHTLAWSLSAVESSTWPSQTAQPERLLAVALQSLQSSPVLRPQSELLDQADLIYRLHWSALNARYLDRDPPDHLQIDVLQERHHALAWLLGLSSLEAGSASESPIPWQEVKPAVSRIREFATPVEPSSSDP